ncbi:MAG: hypothetical protein ACTIDA_03180 [Pseudolactococcus laudensis]
MTELFGKDCEMALATAKGNVPTVRYVDTYYQDSSFYIVTDENSQKAKDIRTWREITRTRENRGK